jgi:hypothetical protein
MSNFLDWRDYTRQPHIKQLIESKGVEAARVQFIKDSNKTLWNDPFIINENHQSPGTSVSNNNAASLGSNAQIYGDTVEVSRFAWVTDITNGITGSNHPTSASIHESYFDVYAYNGTVDYSYDHVDSTKKFRFLIISGSTNYTYSNTSGLAGLITASYTRSETVNVTGSLLRQFKDAIANQGATAAVAGFTNTIAPNTLFTSVLPAAGSGSLTITHVNEGGVPDIATNFTAATASVSVTTNGLDKYYNETGWYTGAVKFDGAAYPYTTLTRKG